MTNTKIAVLGASGAVGREMIKVLIERGHDAESITALGGKSAGTTVDIDGMAFEIKSADGYDFSRAKFVLGAVSAELSRRFAPEITAAGAVYIDNSSAFRMESDVPLVVPEINGEDAFAHNGIVANPNCSTIIAASAIAGINRISQIKEITAATYQAVSGAGIGGMRELKVQNEAILRGEEISCAVFPYRIVENLIPLIGSAAENGYTDEEMKMQNEGRRIFHLPLLSVNCTCVRVPVMRSHSIAMTVYAEKPLDVEEVRNAIKNSEGCILYDDVKSGIYPMPTVSGGRDEVFVGRIRSTLDGRGGVSLFCCGDQLRRGAATNAVKIYELLDR